MANEKRLIDANEAIRHLRGACVAKYPNTFMMGLFASADEIAKLPTVDAVEVVHGRWEDEFGGKYANPRYRCSVCKVRANYKMVQDELMSWHEEQALTPYCPNCGAKMDGDGNG